ncbi:hypothetical protein [Rhodococcus marinonascens]|uniref:hypothetical protein n=1 Tax=Rhodococcus marinonascens TaxID=38311 RepID=UPI000A8B3614|nr:hypothetical protein [Rhodococcus marinonascens]
MRLTLTRSAILTAGLFLAAAPAAAHAQDSIGGGSLPAGSYVQSDSADALWEANRFPRTYTPEQITECREAAAGGVSTGLGPCPTAPITALDLAASRLMFGSMELVFGGS